MEEGQEFWGSSYSGKVWSRQLLALAGLHHPALGPGPPEVLSQAASHSLELSLISDCRPEQPLNALATQLSSLSFGWLGTAWPWPGCPRAARLA